MGEAISRVQDSITPAALWSRYGALRWQDLPADVQEVAQHCLVDWVACTVAGSTEPLAQILRSEFLGQQGPAEILGTDLRVDAKSAALINGATSHALDFDDTNIVMGGHSTVPVLPAALAQAQEQQASGAQLLTALVVGTEVEGRLGAAIGGSHYARGWHVTSSIGVFGATAAVAHLLRLNREQFGHAMGLAASQSSGLKANFGTMTKPFHAGHAAERGLLSARLALRGFTANPEAFTHAQGLLNAAASGQVHEPRLQRLGDDWTTRHTLFKYHAACYLTHAAIESTLQLREQIRAEELASATIRIHPSLLDVCAIANPQTGLEAKFSLAATTVMALLGMDTTNPDTFVDAQVQQPTLQRLLPKVQLLSDDQLGQTQVEVTLQNTAQEQFSALHDSGIPATDLAAQWQKICTKAQGAARLNEHQITALQRTADADSVAQLL